MTSGGELFLIDTDAGLDDAQAILIALASPNITVLGITTVSGNTNVHQVTKNVLRLLKAADQLEIPVYKGSKALLISKETPVELNYHGIDGFGDVPDENPPDFNLVQKKCAAQALVDITKEHEGKITLVALGPLTNLSLAVRLDPDFGKRLKSCFIMGGNYKGVGNITPCAEFNFNYDPEAAHIVLNDLGCPITMVCWELCLECSFPWEKYHELRSVSTSIVKLLNTLDAKMVKKCQEKCWDRYIMCDELCMACAIDNTIKTKSGDYYCTVELHGTHSRGSLVVDRIGVMGKKENVNIVLDIDADKYEQLLKNALQINT
ncbi:hypothetical protein LOTGIDRAFT_158961 [Lottia gigantea]|uniref:Inosine/uridine-preferring nucleoside hydrolase domain-containing protein n=1 Tax=Lottia gigantea TaxID=225164 RepID=V4A517_LOTGI|nr:hypothetical protein LOTGIDRAFT_158961 [Lottia gigantea]ESO98993.1 hypothetical protein LOTGIDRAFT_158961 [Lottia gigantea]